MSEVRERLRERLERFKASPAGYGAKLRFDFAEIIWRNLERKPGSPRRLAKKARLADSVISNLIHGNKNCTLDTVGKVIHALGTEVTLQETTPVSAATDGFLSYQGQTVSFKGTTSVQTPTIEIEKATSTPDTSVGTRRRTATN
jgi:hypothetical protein